MKEYCLSITQLENLITYKKKELKIINIVLLFWRAMGLFFLCLTTFSMINGFNDFKTIIELIAGITGGLLGIGFLIAFTFILPNIIVKSTKNDIKALEDSNYETYIGYCFEKEIRRHNDDRDYYITTHLKGNKKEIKVTALEYNRISQGEEFVIFIYGNNEKNPEIISYETLDYLRNGSKLY